MNVRCCLQGLSSQSHYNNIFQEKFRFHSQKSGAENQSSENRSSSEIHVLLLGMGRHAQRYKQKKKREYFSGTLQDQNLVGPVEG